MSHFGAKTLALTRALFILALFAPVAQTVLAQAAGRQVDLLVVRGPITPIVASYLDRGIDTAEADGAQALIIQLDTPGGSVSVMEEIIQRMQVARVPLVVYVAPQGAKAASAGTFIVLAGHLAAMAPNTTVGAASPVGGGGEDLPSTAEEKATNVLVALIKSLAERRGERAVAWAESAVREAAAANAQEALELGVIDLTASDVPELLTALNGRSVRLLTEDRVLETADARVVDIPMNPFEAFLHAITDPNIAFILMTLGLNGLLFEFANPGGYLAGTIGAISILLALYALGVLSANFTGLLFIALAFILFVADVTAPTHGILTATGIFSFIIGSLLLFNTPFAPVSQGLVVGVGLGSGLFFAFVIAKALRAQRRRATTGHEGLIGSVAVARSDLNPHGRVFLWGEWWDAVAQGEPVAAGDRVRVVGREGFKLMVEKVGEDAR